MKGHVSRDLGRCQAITSGRLPLVRLSVLLLFLSLGKHQTLGQEPKHEIQLSPPIRSADNDDSSRRLYPRALRVRSGTIERFDDDVLSIRLPGESEPLRFSSNRVVAVRMLDLPQDQRAAIEQFESGDFDAALPALIRSISEHDAATRPPVWRQQWLSMLAAQAAMRSGRGDLALELVGQLDARPLPSLIWGLLPIDWTGRHSRDAMIDMAARGARSDSLAVKLVAASWLLRSPKYREVASTAIDRMATQQQRIEVADLASQLRWRTQSPPEIRAGLRRWELQIHSLPMSMQTGPMLALADLSRQIGSSETAKKWDLLLKWSPPSWHPQQVLRSN